MEVFDFQPDGAVEVTTNLSGTSVPKDVVILYFEFDTDDGNGYRLEKEEGLKLSEMGYNEYQYGYGSDDNDDVFFTGNGKCLTIYEARRLWHKLKEIGFEEVT